MSGLHWEKCQAYTGKKVRPHWTAPESENPHIPSVGLTILHLGVSRVFVALLGRLFSLVYTMYTMYTYNIIYLDMHTYVYANTYRDVRRITCE